MQFSHKFFENKDCQYYPCHKLKKINCLFCFCLYYHLKNCGGKFIKKGKIKDCSQCTFPHKKKNYAKIMKKLIQK
jgi:Zn-finger protein